MLLSSSFINRLYCFEELAFLVVGCSTAGLEEAVLGSDLVSADAVLVPAEVPLPLEASWLLGGALFCLIV